MILIGSYYILTDCVYSSYGIDPSIYITERDPSHPLGKNPQTEDSKPLDIQKSVEELISLHLDNEEPQERNLTFQKRSKRYLESKNFNVLKIYEIFPSSKVSKLLRPNKIWCNFMI